MTHNTVEETPENETKGSVVREPILPQDFVTALGDAVIAFSGDETSFELTVRPEAIREVITWLVNREPDPYQHLSSLCGIDYGDELGVVYHLYQLGKPNRVVLHVRMPRQEPKVPSIADIIPAANWKEREAMELFGIEFIGHPDPRKLLLPEGWEGYPLRKDYG
ncbi:MAG: NADH-quinone oxidoreductase subunit C [Candidatus Zipacnadales bacterium]